MRLISRELERRKVIERAGTRIDLSGLVVDCYGILRREGSEDCTCCTKEERPRGMRDLGLYASQIDKMGKMRKSTVDVIAAQALRYISMKGLEDDFISFRHDLVAASASWLEREE